MKRNSPDPLQKARTKVFGGLLSPWRQSGKMSNLNMSVMKKSIIDQLWVKTESTTPRREIKIKQSGISLVDELRVACDLAVGRDRREN